MNRVDELYANKISLKSVLPLLKVIVENNEKMANKFKDITAVIQFSAMTEGIKIGMHFIVENGVWTVGKDVHETPNLEFQFKTIEHFNSFFAGKSKRLPKIIGWKNMKLLISTFSLLLLMAKLLQSTKPPKKVKDRELLVKLFFYLLSSGISQLNKAGHPEIIKWTKRSPDRVFAWSVEGKPELSAYIRVKAGNSKAARGEYKRSKPFFTMKFDSIDSALGILLELDDMIDSTVKGKLIMEGAPEYGAQLGEYMLLVGSYAK